MGALKELSYLVEVIRGLVHPSLKCVLFSCPSDEMKITMSGYVI